MKIRGQKENMEILQLATEQDIPALLIGETGTGKTTMIRELAQEQGKELIRFNMTGETSVDEFVGKPTLKENENGNVVVEYLYGVLPTAMQKGHWLVVDEINVALAEILFVLHSLLDDDKSIRLSNHDNRKITPHKDFRFFATMNPVEEYAGTKELNKAFLSRFAIVLNIDYPQPRDEQEIVTSQSGVDRDMAVQMVDIANKIRGLKADDEVFYTCSTRDLISWGKLTERLGLERAFNVSIVNKATQDAEALGKVFSDVVGQYKKLKDDGKPLNIDTITEELEKLEQRRQTLEQEVYARVKEMVMDKIGKLGTEQTTDEVAVDKAKQILGEA